MQPLTDLVTFTSSDWGKEKNDYCMYLMAFARVALQAFEARQDRGQQREFRSAVPSQD